MPKPVRKMQKNNALLMHSEVRKTEIAEGRSRIKIDCAIVGLVTGLLCGGIVSSTTLAQDRLDPMPDLSRLVDVPAPDGATMRAYVALPQGTGPHPAIVILHGTEGFNANQQVLADDFAAAGFVAVAACWFKGKHVPPSFSAPPNIPCANGPVFDGANMKTANNALAIVDFTRALPEVDRERVGLWGHSRGGTIVLLLAARNAPVRAVVAAAPIYAHPKRGGAYNDEFPIRFLDRMKLPVLMLQGTKDQIIPVEEAREFEAAARAAGLALEAEYYEGMEHSMFYKGAKRDAARTRAIAFFRETLVGGSGERKN